MKNVLLDEGIPLALQAWTTLLLKELACSVTLTCGACEVCWWWVWLAGPPIAVPGSAGDLFGEVAPLMLVVVQVVALTQQVAGTTVVALVVPNNISLNIQI